MHTEKDGETVCECTPFDRKQLFFVTLQLKFNLCPWAAPFTTITHRLRVINSKIEHTSLTFRLQVIHSLLISSRR